MRRTDLHEIAEGKIADAQLLLAHRRYANAYYLAGYAVEIGLKACASRQIVGETIPDRSFLKTIFTHDFSQLVRLAGLKAELDRAGLATSRFLENWAIASEWRPESRYETIDASSASMLVNAVAENDSGVLPWIRAYW
ncbi:hypothetical protein U0C82_12695 [Fulvimarina sp. 2208YS6-2-32]|uniref:HEPN domain-containing protein n=1 Tax=Fulvimarina uroteuthidis TaxID=3098149 RepID=A0ABU5I4Y6_9HYPH|nr:hypothetical protein [Fulvimarina sp. 2208YS6-2-32]MDY8109998.1 hypothetical protein [Fulvimarina sp. 2208YS6-2-32]